MFYKSITTQDATSVLIIAIRLTSLNLQSYKLILIHQITATGYRKLCAEIYIYIDQ